MEVQNNNLFITGFITNFSDGTRLLERKVIQLTPNTPFKSYPVKDTDTLLGIAKRFYGDCKYWFILADVNNVEFPMEVESGTIIKIPDLKYVLSLL